MIGWILMLLDILSLVSITLVQFKVPFAVQFALIASGYLIMKGFLFKDFMSIIDSIIGFYLLIAFIFGISSFLYWIILAWFLYKLFFTVLYSGFGG